MAQCCIFLVMKLITFDNVLTNLCNSDVELRKCCGRCFGAVPALRRRESVGFAFLGSDEREDDLTERYPIAGNPGGKQVVGCLDKGMPRTKPPS